MSWDALVVGRLVFPKGSLARWLSSTVDVTAPVWPDGFGASSRWPAQSVEKMLGALAKLDDGTGLVKVTTSARTGRVAVTALLERSELRTWQRPLAAAFLAAREVGGEGRFAVLAPHDEPRDVFDAAIASGARARPRLRRRSRKADITRLRGTAEVVDAEKHVARIAARLVRALASSVDARVGGVDWIAEGRAALAAYAPASIHDAVRDLEIWVIPRTGGAERLHEIFDPGAMKAVLATGAGEDRIDPLSRRSVILSVWLVLAKLGLPDARRFALAMRDAAAKGALPEGCAVTASEVLGVLATPSDIDAHLAWVRRTLPDDASDRKCMALSARSEAWVDGPARGLDRLAASAEGGPCMLDALARTVGPSPFRELPYGEATFAEWLACSLARQRVPAAAPLLASLAEHPDRDLRESLARASSGTFTRPGAGSAA